MAPLFVVQKAGGPFASRQNSSRGHSTLQRPHITFDQMETGFIGDHSLTLLLPLSLLSSLPEKFAPESLSEAVFVHNSF